MKQVPKVQRFSILNNILIIASFFCLCGCDYTLEKLSNEWYVEEVIHLKDTIVKGSFPENRLYFNPNGNCYIPNDFKFAGHKRVNGRWSYETVADSPILVIEAPNSILNGQYHISFHRYDDGIEELLLHSTIYKIKAWRRGLN